MKICKPLAIALLCGAATTSGIGHAGDFIRRVVHSQQSVTTALGGASLPLLTRGARSNVQSAARGVLEAICPAPCAAAKMTASSDTLRVVAPGWELEISDNGTRGRFRDVAVESASHGQGVPVGGGMSETALESAGRKLIASKLSSVVVLGAGEKLVPVATARRTEGGQSAQGGPVQTAVIANRIVFGRTIDGVPVVGGGSTVSITFDNAGAVETFDYDWPTYARTGAVRSTVSSVEVLDRLQKFVVASTRDPASGAPAKSTSPAYPVELTSASNLVRLECGYYDRGPSSTGAHSNAIQSACAYHVVHSKGSGERVVFAGLAGAIPAAQHVEPDGSWPEAAFVLKMPAVAPSEPRSAGSSSTRK